MKDLSFHGEKGHFHLWEWWQMGYLETLTLVTKSLNSDTKDAKTRADARSGLPSPFRSKPGPPLHSLLLTELRCSLRDPQSFMCWN